MTTQSTAVFDRRKDGSMIKQIIMQKLARPARHGYGERAGADQEGQGGEGENEKKTFLLLMHLVFFGFFLVIGFLVFPKFLVQKLENQVKFRQSGADQKGQGGEGEGRFKYIILLSRQRHCPPLHQHFVLFPTLPRAFESIGNQAPKIERRWR